MECDDACTTALLQYNVASLFGAYCITNKTITVATSSTHYSTYLNLSLVHRKYLYWVVIVVNEYEKEKTHDWKKWDVYQKGRKKNRSQKKVLQIKIQSSFWWEFYELTKSIKNDNKIMTTWISMTVQRVSSGRSSASSRVEGVETVQRQSFVPVVHDAIHFFLSIIRTHYCTHIVINIGSEIKNHKQIFFADQAMQ